MRLAICVCSTGSYAFIFLLYRSGTSLERRNFYVFIGNRVCVLAAHIKANSFLLVRRQWVEPAAVTYRYAPRGAFPCLSCTNHVTTKRCYVDRKVISTKLLRDQRQA